MTLLAFFCYWILILLIVVLTALVFGWLFMGWKIFFSKDKD